MAASSLPAAASGSGPVPGVEAKFVACEFKTKLVGKVYLGVPQHACPGGRQGEVYWEFRCFDGCMTDENQRPAARCARYSKHLVVAGVPTEQADRHFLQSHDSARKRARAEAAGSAAEGPPAKRALLPATQTAACSSSSSGSALPAVAALPPAGAESVSAQPAGGGEQEAGQEAAASTMPRALAHRRRSVAAVSSSVTVPEFSGTTLCMIILLAAAACASREALKRSKAAQMLETLVHYCLRGLPEGSNLQQLCHRAWPGVRPAASGPTACTENLVTQALMRSRGRPLFLHIAQLVSDAGNAAVHRDPGENVRALASAGIWQTLQMIAPSEPDSLWSQF